MLADWSWLLPARVRPIAATRFGDCLLEVPNGEVLFLDLLEGTAGVVVTKRDELDALLKTKQGRELLSADMVELLWGRGVQPGDAECYGYKLPPVLGGSVGSDNVRLWSRALYVALQGQLHRQVSGAR